MNLIDDLKAKSHLNSNIEIHKLCGGNQHSQFDKEFKF